MRAFTGISGGVGGNGVTGGGWIYNIIITRVSRGVGEDGVPGGDNFLFICALYCRFGGAVLKSY